MPFATSKQHRLWLLAAIAAPAAHFCGSGWLVTALAAACVLPLTLVPGEWEGLSAPLVWLEIAWLGIVAGFFLKNSAAYWPSDNDLVVPLTLLILAACTNAAAAPRIGAVLAFCMALLAIPLAVCAATHIEAVWVAPASAPWPVGLTVALLLPTLPAAGGARKGSGAAYAALLTITLAFAVQGIISPAVAANVPEPFYQTARTMGHLEPVAAVAMTLGWYAVTVFLFQSAAILAEKSGNCRKRAGVLAVGTATGSLFFLQQPYAAFMSVVSLFLWVFMPFVRKINVFEKS